MCVGLCFLCQDPTVIKLSVNVRDNPKNNSLKIDPLVDHVKRHFQNDETNLKRRLKETTKVKLSEVEKSGKKKDGGSREVEEVAASGAQ